MTDRVLGQAAWPAADHRYLRLRQWAEDAGQLHLCDGDGLVISAAHQAICRGSAEEGADEAATGGDAVVELLVDEGAGHEQVSGAGWDEESEAGRQSDGLRA